MCKSLRLWQTAPVSYSRSSKPLTADPAWRSSTSLQAAGLPASVRPWLLDEGSLTARLIDKSQGEFRVQRLHQGWQRPLLSEQRLLGLGAAQWALVREVVLRCFDQPWVYARSIIPASTLSGKLRRLRHLQNESLGELLFQHPKLMRDEFELALLPPGSTYIHSSLQQDSPAWARRSRFILDGRALMVSEVFLQQFQA
ncbi:MAG: chorismate lyase [Halieaceae bacterium]